MKAFTPAYLSGFYADTSDVDAKVYQGDAEYTASAETTERIASDGTFAGFTMDTIRPEQLHTKTETIDSTMFPVWFLSYRKKDRVAYATVNGQTGLVVADIPIDPKRYLLGSLLLAIPIFALLAWSAFLNVSFNAPVRPFVAEWFLGPLKIATLISSEEENLSRIYSA